MPCETCSAKRRYLEETPSVLKVEDWRKFVSIGVSSSGKSNRRKARCERVRTVGSDSHLKGREWELNGCRWRWSKRGSFLV